MGDGGWTPTSAGRVDRPDLVAQLVCLPQEGHPTVGVLRQDLVQVADGRQDSLVGGYQFGSSPGPRADGVAQAQGSSARSPSSIWMSSRATGVGGGPQGTPDLGFSRWPRFGTGVVGQRRVVKIFIFEAGRSIRAGLTRAGRWRGRVCGCWRCGVRRRVAGSGRGVVGGWWWTGLIVVRQRILPVFGWRNGLGLWGRGRLVLSGSPSGTEGPCSAAAHHALG